MEPAPRNSPRLEVLAVPQSCMSVPLEPTWDSHSRRGWSCTWDLRYLLRTERIQVQIVKVRLKSIPGFQDSRIRDYQWLPCHTVSIRNPQISRTRFVVDCSAFLPALGWLVAFCAAKAWRTNAHSLRSLGTQSRKDRKRVLSSTESLFSGASRRCATVRHGRICFESVAIWRFCVLFWVFLSLRVWTRPPVLLFWLRPRVTKQFANIDQVESSLSIYQVYQVSQTSDEMWDVLSTMCHIKGFVDQISDEPWCYTMNSNDKPWFERVFGLQTATAWFLSMGERYQQERESAEHGKMSMSIAGRGLMMLPDLSGGCSAVALCGAVVLKSFEILDPYIWSFKPARLF